MTSTPITTAPPAPDSLLEKLTKDPDFTPAKDGIEAYGFYVELIRFHKATREFNSHYRLFVFQNSFAVYQRVAGKKAGRWHVEYAASHDDARNAMFKLVASFENQFAYHLEVRGEPLLIQASVADVVAVKNKEKHGPDCRWKGIGIIEGRYGKVTDELKPSTLPEAVL